MDPIASLQDDSLSCKPLQIASRTLHSPHSTLHSQPSTSLRLPFFSQETNLFEKRGKQIVTLGVQKTKDEVENGLLEETEKIRGDFRKGRSDVLDL